MTSSHPVRKPLVAVDRDLPNVYVVKVYPGTPPGVKLLGSLHSVALDATSRFLCEDELLHLIHGLQQAQKTQEPTDEPNEGESYE